MKQRIKIGNTKLKAQELVVDPSNALLLTFNESASQQEIDNALKVLEYAFSSACINMPFVAFRKGFLVATNISAMEAHKAARAQEKPKLKSNVIPFRRYDDDGDYVS
ncbi:MAG TPA: hypothetical protein V6C86_24300 [Oculatellaceae cyanobacterium]